MFNFVESFLEYTKDAESPTSYFRWAAYTTIAAVMRDSVWIDLVHQKIYPNMYTLILSRRSSLVKKSTPLRTSMRLLQEINNTKIIHGRATIAGIIGVMTHTKMNFENQPMNGGQCVLYSEEMSSMFIEDHYATDTLTDWYDCYTGKIKWTSTLSSTGPIEVSDLCLTVLGSSNEELIRTVFDSRANQGGLLARTFLIIESQKRLTNSLMFVERQTNTDSEMISHLKRVSRMKGEMTMEHAAKVFYDEWYNSFKPLAENSSTTGVEGRLHIHALKLAMVKSASEGYSRVITKRHIEEAIQECLDLLPNYKLFSTGSNGPLEKIGRDLILCLLESKDFTMPKHKVMWNFWTHGSQLVNNTLEALSEAQNIEMFTHDETKDLCIRLTKSFIDRLQQKKKENDEKHSKNGTGN